ncbi:MAG TPA: GerMN domain-containing protein [Dissulfurispiraceae bacterium]
MKDKKHIVIAAVATVLLFAGSAGWLVTRYYLSQQGAATQPLIELKDSTPGVSPAFSETDGETVQVKIFSPSEDGLSMQEKMIQGSPLPVKMAEDVIAEYLKGLKAGLRDTKLLGVYRDRNNVLYIDLSDEFRKNFSGDAGQEFLLLKALYETVSSNISGIEDVRLLVEGKELESLGGHVGILCPLKETVKD